MFQPEAIRVYLDATLKQFVEKHHLEDDKYAYQISQHIDSDKPTTITIIRLETSKEVVEESPVPHSTEKKSTLFLHNITPSIFGIIGGGFPELLEAFYKEWIEKGISTFNVSDTILSVRFKTRFMHSDYAETFDQHTIDQMIIYAKSMSCNIKTAQHVKNVDTALKMYLTKGVFNDKKAITSLLNHLEKRSNTSPHYRNSYLASKVRFSIPVQTTTIDPNITTMSHKKDGKRVRQGVADALLEQYPEVNESVIYLICCFVYQFGTPEFFIEYNRYVEEEYKRLNTLARPEDLEELVGGMFASK